MEKQAIARVAPSATPAAFIQADAATFKDLVQKLTGAAAHKLRPTAVPFKLRERRKQSLSDLEIIKLGAAGNSPGKKTRSSNSNELVSPVTAPRTPLGCESEAWERVRADQSPPSEEEKAIADKGFYLHASPAKAEPPVLLTLFPLTP